MSVEEAVVSFLRQFFLYNFICFQGGRGGGGRGGGGRGGGRGNHLFIWKNNQKMFYYYY